MIAGCIYPNRESCGSLWLTTIRPGGRKRVELAAEDLRGSGAVRGPAKKLAEKLGQKALRMRVSRLASIGLDLLGHSWGMDTSYSEKRKHFPDVGAQAKTAKPGSPAVTLPLQRLVPLPGSPDRA